MVKSVYKSDPVGRNADDAEMVSLMNRKNNTSGNNDNDEDSSTNKRTISMKCMAIIVAVMLGCYHLGRWSCMVEHEESSLFQGIVKSKHGDDEELQFHQAASESSSSGGGDLHSLTYERLREVRQKCHDLIGMLDQYYSGHKGGPKSVLLGEGGWTNGWNYDVNDTNQVRPTLPPREEKIVDTIARALLNPHQDTFIIGTIGSSVAAGHDNCRYDNYEEQLQRLWSPIWEAAGMKLDIQNAGQGGGCGDSHRNQVWCIKQNVSPFVDIIHYSWSYFEAGGGGKPERESLVRWAQLLDKAPPVHKIDVMFETGCMRTDKGEMQLFDAYQEYGYNAFCMRYAILKSQHREVKTKKQGEVLMEGQHTGDGFHNTTRYGEFETDQDRKDSLGVVLRNWHPGPLGFQVISDAVAYTYSTAMLHALDRIESVVDMKKVMKKPTKALIPSNKTAVEANWWKDRPIVLGKHLRDPIVCDPEYCQVDQPPQCLNFELPTFGWWGASITPADDDLNPWRGDVQKWESWKEDNGPTKMVNKLEASMYADTPEFCEFPDFCAGIQAKSPDQGRIVFKLPKMEVGMAAVCFCCGKAVAEKQLYNNTFVEVVFNDRLLNHSTFDIFPERKCVRVIKEHGTSVGDTGHSYLSLRLLEGNKETITISHVITI